MPLPAYNSKVGKGKGRGKGKGEAIKRKVKEIRFRVVWVYPGTTCTPPDRNSRTKEVWIRVDASADDVSQRIREELMWPEDQAFQYMYARGKSLRVAKLADVENAVDWDCTTLKVLMGTGYLYIAKSTCVEMKEVMSHCMFHNSSFSIVFFS